MDDADDFSELRASIAARWPSTRWTDTEWKAVLSCDRDVYHGLLDGMGTTYSNHLKKEKRHAEAGLTPSERAVLRKASEGWTATQTANHLGISAETVKSHLTRVRNKLKARNTVHAAAIAIRNGVLDGGPTALDTEHPDRPL